MKNIVMIIPLSSPKEKEKLIKIVSQIKLLQKSILFSLEENFRSIEIYHTEIYNRLYANKNISKENIDQELNMFDCAYTLMKQAFHGKNRINKESNKQEQYFTHLQAVMEIVLRELPSPNMNKIVIALLHDVLEDIPGYSYETLVTIYGEYIAKGVLALSKKNRREYLNEKEKKIYETCDEEKKYLLRRKAKKRRNKEYFGHMESLPDDYLAVKMADRIHNLRTMEHFSNEKVSRKIQETKKYFLPLAKKKMPEAYKLLLQEIKNLEHKKIKNTKLKIH